VSFARFTNKLGLIQSVFNKPQRLSVERQIARAFEERRSSFSISRPHSEVLQLDMLYALARHARWVKVPLFKDVLVDFLVTEHEIPRALSESMVNDVLESCEALLGDDPEFTASELLQGKVDEEFLTYIFVAAASSSQESAVREQLGLGAGLLRSLKSAADSLAVQDSGSGSAGGRGTRATPKLFLPDVDTVFARIMIKLTEAVRDCPWVLDVYRLKYLLLEKLDRQRFAILATHVPAVYEFLCAAGRQNHRATDEETLARMWSEIHDDKDISFPVLVQLLEAAGLIFRTDVRRRGKKQQVLWDLTPLAEQLTAEAYVSTRVSRAGTQAIPGAQVDLDWYDAPATWRRGYLQQAIAQSPVEKLRQAVDKLSPRIDDPALAESVIEALVKSNMPDLAESAFISWSGQILQPPSVSAICRAGALIKSRPSVRSRLQSIAESHDSLAVRAAALEALL
jgi:hypothetical protein